MDKELRSVLTLLCDSSESLELAEQVDQSVLCKARIIAQRAFKAGVAETVRLSVSAIRQAQEHQEQVMGSKQKKLVF